MAGRAADSDLTLKISFELEWFVAETARGPAVPAYDGPGVGAHDTQWRVASEPVFTGQRNGEAGLTGTVILLRPRPSWAY
jgi:hypothetical protein